MHSVETHASHLRVHFGSSKPSHADFHYLWLRNACDDDRHPLTRERILDASDLSLEVRPKAARIEGSVLVVEWEGESRVSRYPEEFLRQHAYAADREAVSPPPSDVQAIELDAAELSTEAAAAAAHERVRRDGAVIVRRFAGGRDPEAATKLIVEAFAARGLGVRTTHFGYIEDLRTDNTTNANTDQLGYTDAPVDLHTDQPFLEDPPRYQLLQCLRPAAEGGENQVADAQAAARYLASENRDAAELLRTLPVRFHRKQKAFEAIVDAPILRDDAQGFQVRASYFTLAPHQHSFDRMEAYYAAYRRFFRLVRDPRHQYRFRLDAGDFLFYDNHRMLHARSSFRGARWLRGIYFDEFDDRREAP